MTTNDDWSGVPAGYEQIGFRVPENGEDFIGIDGRVITCSGRHAAPRLIVRKLPPRLVPLEASDIPPLSCVRSGPKESWQPVQFVFGDSLYVPPVKEPGSIRVPLLEAMETGWQILRPGSTEWQPCSKPEGAVS